MNVQALIDAAIGREGGYSNHPADTGGATRWGVTEQVARAYGYAGDMRDLPRDTAVSIYKSRYWDEPNFDLVADIYPQIGDELFDTGINAGQDVAAKMLQRALNLLNREGNSWPDIRVDGRIGPMTLQCLRTYRGLRGAEGEAVLLKVLDGLQVAHYVAITEARPANEAFFYGWIRTRIGQA